MTRWNGPAGTVDRTSAPLKLHLLGRFEVVRGESPIPAQSWRRRRPADLLKLIALSPGRLLPRDQAIDVLWPEKDPASGANNLHRALYDLRQILGGRWVDLERGVVRMRPDVWVDVDAFEEAVATGGRTGLESAVAIYRGDLSPEDLESPWLQPRRVALRRAFALSAFPLAREAAGRVEYTIAIPLLRRVLAVDSANEEAHQLLMRLLAESGRRADALRQYDACELAMRSIGHAAPSSETRALRDAVQHGQIGPSQAKPSFDGYRRACRRLLGLAEPTPLRGRTATLLLLESTVEQGSGALVLLGEQGVGKTRLAVEGARIAQERGALVLTGLSAATGPAPFALFADAWADYQRAHGLPEHDLLAGLGAADAGAPDAHKLRLLEAVQRWLTSVAGARAVYLLCEDIHLADESSLNLLHWLARQAKASKLMIVATCREDEVRAGSPIQMHLSHLDCERLGRGIRVQRLTLDATREQIADILESPPADALVARIYRITDGSPFYTEEVVRAFRESSHLVVPDSPVEAVRGRVARLGGEVAALLAAAAVVGRRFDFEVVRSVAGLTAHEALRALDRCLEAKVIEEGGTLHHFHHSLVHDAVYESLPAAQRERLHRAVADVLEAKAAAGGSHEIPERLAHHRLAAQQPAAAARHFAAAGHLAMTRAGLSEALGFFEKAVALTDAAQLPNGERLELLEAMGRAQMALADLSGLDRTFETAANLAQQAHLPVLRGRARRLQALGLAVGGDFEAAESRLEEAGAELADRDEAAEMLHLRALLRWHAGDGWKAAELAERAAAEAAASGDPELAARARDTAALARASLGLEAPLPERGECGGEPNADPPFDLHLVLWTRMLVRGDRSLGELQTEAALFGERARQRGDMRALATGLAIEGAVALEAARWDVAEAALRDAAGLYGSIGCGLGESFALDRLGLLLTARGRLDEGMAALGSGILAAERAMLRRHALARLHTTLARNRLAAGALYSAEDSLREASETAARHGPCAICDAALRPEAVRVALARGRIQEADGEAEALEALAATRRDRALGALARVARARVLVARGAADEAIALLDQAREMFTAIGAAYEAARCLVVRVRALEGAGPDRAAERERLAREAATALEAVGGSAADA